MQRRLPPHPSGRPVRRSSKTALSIQRIPAEAPLTPRLQSRDLGEVVGFHADFIGADPEEDD
jgi:hypothetical protein